ncbi:putative Zn(II)2Cys6 transcription factor [Aspergillus mulundensis]|uniref:Putative Zn(II)2Cys6 transcription factor n=1 Tax=Aspergillus mulundensis TaxID=1810919 RepID=A0A3D8SB85_9EURO|nr:putative Zn(II)2Cys6 transcription factor [Aspergillus mulundensis]RDW83576.1 putative Zn(II)2Cys6 transcription factor [Aspergillus mulundensis]
MPQKSQARDTSKPARQQPGLACEECRKRKARCDRAKPQCGSCLMTGRVCIVNHNRPRRGPKKGQIESLYSRLGRFIFVAEMRESDRERWLTVTEVLEEQVVEQMDHIYHGDLESQEQLALTHDVRRHSSSGSSSDARHDVPFLLSPSALDTTTTERTLLPSPFANVRPLPAQGSAYTGSSMSPSPGLDIVLADLDQLYFDRVHPIAPFLHQQRHLSHLETEPPLLARACLRSAMRTVAAAMSAQFRRLADSLYVETSRVVMELDTIERTPPLEQIQAVLLLAHYELLRMEESRAMVTAGRCFRLIQLSRLHDTDAYGNNGGDFVANEEKRRTFWVAYCFDRVLSSRHEWPLTLQEEATWIRLPVPESTFQMAQPIDQPMDFLHEAIATSGQKALPPFAEYIVLATLHGRTMNLRRSALLLSTSTEASMFYERQKALSSVIEKRSTLWSYSPPSSTPLGMADPLVAFTHLLGKMMMISIGEVGEVAREHFMGISNPVRDAAGLEAVQLSMAIGGQELLINGDGYSTPAAGGAGDMQRSAQAASEFVALAKSMCPVNCFRAHPFLPNAVFRTAVYLATHNNGTEAGRIQCSHEVEDLRQILKELKVVNNLAREVLRELGSLTVPLSIATAG